MLITKSLTVNQLQQPQTSDTRELFLM